MTMQYKIKYLGHSAFIVEIDEYYLFFDYVGETTESGYSVHEAIIDFNNYRDKKVIMFYSHDHFDHYNRLIHKETQKYENIVSVLGDITSDLANTITIKPRELKEIKGIKVYAGASTDAGVCYLIAVDNFVIYYGGDNADWGDGSEFNKVYYQEIDYFASLGMKVNVAFIPVCNFLGQRPTDMTKGAIYSIKKLEPQVTVPMHSAGLEYLYKEFYADALKQHITNEVICMEHIGQTYEREG